MCTVSWQFDSSGYQLFFNRDELNSRRPALPPAIKQHHNTHIIAPTDTDAGGSWISVNEHGLTLCLLNNYAAPAQITDQDWISRGQLVSNYSHLSDPDGVLNQLQAIPLHHYRPFDLLVLSLNDHIWQLNWDGLQLQQIKDPEMPLTSSSFETAAVINSRLQQFSQLSSPTAMQLQRYHASHQPERGGYSVCMHRDNGQTVSFSHISVNRSHINFNYYAGSPCQVNKPHTTSFDIHASKQSSVAR